MKIKLLVIVIVLLSVTKIYAQTSDTCCTNVLLTGYSEKLYTSKPVTDQQLELILKCGIKAPSSRNKQPWKFAVIKDVATMRQIMDDIVPGNILIIISGMVSESGTTPDFDCGLAAQSMFVAAHCLKLGARIYGGPVESINTNKELFQIPTKYKAVAALRIGNIDKSVDAVSAASPRKAPEEVICYKNRN